MSARRQRVHRYGCDRGIADGARSRAPPRPIHRRSLGSGAHVVTLRTMPTTRLTDRKMNTLQLTGLLRHDIRYWRSEAIKLCDSSSVESCRNLALEVCENIETLRCVGTRPTPPSFAGWVLTVALTLAQSPRSALALCRLFAACVRLGIDPYIAIAMGFAFWVGVALGVGVWMVWRWV